MTVELPTKGGVSLIYQLKVSLKHTKPPIWRRLQVYADTTFHQLHHILQIAFDWDDQHLHVFRPSKIPDQKRDVTDETHDLFSFFGDPGNEMIGIGDPEFNEGWGTFFDEKEEKLSDWLQQEKDKITYTYDFGDDWEHLIVLERILPPEADVPYPRCVKVRHLAPEEDSRGEWLEKEWSEKHPGHQTDAQFNREIQDEVNARFRERDDVLQVHPPSPQSNDVDTYAHWRPLFELVIQYKRLKPWQWMSDIDMFAVVDPDSEETGYCCVLGEGGEMYGLAVYIGDEGFRSLIEITESEGQVEPHEQRSVLLSFNDRGDLAKEDYRLIKDLGLSFRGRNAWPVFRSFVPGYVPWRLEKWEVRFLTNVLEQVIHVCQRVKDDPQLIAPRDDRLFARIAERTDKGLVWRDGSVPDSVPSENRDFGCYASEIELARLRRSYPMQEGIIESDVSYFPEPVQDEEADRPYFPYLYLCLDAVTGMVVDHQLLHHERAAEHIQQRFVQMIQKMGYIPASIHIDNEVTYYILSPLAKELGMTLMRAELHGIHQVKQGMLSGPSFL